MDDRRFDALVRSLASGASRRTVLRTLGGGMVGALFGLRGKRATAADEEEFTGDAAVEVAVGDLRSAVEIDASADAGASASATGGSGDVVEVTLTDVEGGDGGGGGDGGDVVVIEPAPGACQTDADCPDPDTDPCTGSACADGQCVSFAVICPDGFVCCDNGACCPEPPPNPCALILCPECRLCDPVSGACVAANQGGACGQGGTCCAGTCCQTDCGTAGACPTS